MRKFLQRRWIRDNQGQALVEFALVLPLLLLFLYAVIQFGLIFYAFITIEEATREGVRLASLGETATQIGQAIDSQVTGGGLSPSATTSAQYIPPGHKRSTTDRLAWGVQVQPSNSSTPSTISVQVAYLYPVVIPVFGPANFQLQQTYTMAQEDPPNPSIPVAQEGPGPLGS